MRELTGYTLFTIWRRLFARPVWPVVAAILLANLFVAALAGVSLQASRQQHLERAAMTAHNMSLLVSQSIASEIDRLDMSLLAVQDEYARQLSAGGIGGQTLTGFLRRRQERLPMSAGLRIMDAGGNLVFGADKELPAGINVPIATISSRREITSFRDCSSPGRCFPASAANGL